MTLRLFVAITPPEDTRRALLRALARLDFSPALRVRPTPAHQVHMTVQFIGETEDRDVESVTESVQRSASGLPPFALRVGSLQTLPERGPPRVVAAITDAPAALLELHRRLAMRLARSPRGRRDERFLPHLTLCRFGGSGTPPRVALEIDLPPFVINHVQLMRSELRPQGAVHEEVARVGLEGGT